MVVVHTESHMEVKLDTSRGPLDRSGPEEPDCRPIHAPDRQKVATISPFSLTAVRVTSSERGMMKDNWKKGRQGQAPPIKTPRLRNSSGNPFGSPPSLETLYYHFAIAQ